LRILARFQEAISTVGSWYLTTVAGTGGDGALLISNELKYRGKVRSERVLAEPFPWTVTQGVILVLVIINSQL